MVLFGGLIQAFLHRMRAVAFLATGSAKCSDDQLSLFDWSALLTGGQLNTVKLNLPRGWPFTDPGYQLVTQMLTNTSLLSLVCSLFPVFEYNLKRSPMFLFCLVSKQLTGLLEVGLYRLLEYSSSSSSYAMARTTGAILRIFEQILPHEQLLLNLVRRASLLVPHLR